MDQSLPISVNTTDDKISTNEGITQSLAFVVVVASLFCVDLLLVDQKTELLLTGKLECVQQQQRLQWEHSLFLC